MAKDKIKPRFKLAGRPGVTLKGSLKGKCLPIKSVTIEDKETVQRILLGSDGITLIPLNEAGYKLAVDTVKGNKMIPPSKSGKLILDIGKRYKAASDSMPGAKAVKLPEVKKPVVKKPVTASTTVDTPKVSEGNSGNSNQTNQHKNSGKNGGINIK